MKSKWSLVIHEVSQTSANVWVGTLFDDLRKPRLCRVCLYLDDTLVEAVDISRVQWSYPFRPLKKRFYSLIHFEGLSPGLEYRVEFCRAEQQIGEHTLEEKPLAKGSFRTLPKNLKKKTPFVVALGSCYYDEGDGGKLGDSYTSLYQGNDAFSRPDIKFLTGDQVYLDIGLDSLSPVTDEIQCRIADDYAIAWQSMRPMLRQGGSWMLPDDHEYWNNYPYNSGLTNPYLWMISASKTVRNVWKTMASEGVKKVQNTRPVRTFSIGEDLAFCVADLRSQRQTRVFLPEPEFAKIIDWAQSLTCPGVLVLPQPLLVEPGGNEDKNLANFTDQYARLLRALGHSGHDIVCLSGDVHFGRVAQVPLGKNGATLHEVISSPMSNLTGLDGRIAAGKAEKLKYFPAIDVEDVPRNKVVYPSKWKIKSKQVGRWFNPFKHKKTCEHIFTLAFTKDKKGYVKLAVQAWLVRDQDRSGRPKPQFAKAHEMTLSKG